MLLFLYSLSIINNYKTFNAKKFKLAKRSKKGPINSAGPFNINNP